MQSNEKKKILEDIYQYWIDCRDIILFGCGNNSMKYIKELKKNINIVAIVDNDKKKVGLVYEDIDIINISTLQNKYRNKKIVVATHYNEIAESLKKLNFVENEDFCSLDKFIAMWYWFNQKKVCLSEVHMAITTKCTLKCKNCNMYIPYHGFGENISMENVKENIDLLFRKIDKVYVFCLLGGEPLMHPHLEEIIEYIGSKYKEKIVNLEITTNGMIIPNEKLLKSCYKHKVLFNISDYSKNITYPQSIGCFQKTLDLSGISYKTNRSLQWVDFSFPHDPLDLEDRLLANHMKNCAPVFKGINDKKFYYCHIVWSAVKAGILAENKDNYFDLTKLNEENNFDKLKLLEYSLGGVPRGYLDLCKYCGGCGADNKNFVEPALQMSKNKLK
jgi:organic radical activating enzyme